MVLFLLLQEVIKAAGEIVNKAKQEFLSHLEVKPPEGVSLKVHLHTDIHFPRFKIKIYVIYMNTLIKEQYNCLYLLMENKGTKIALVVLVYFRE